ncbi:MAG: hypothetical protein PF961_09000 [Planctomycetota bacterium]|jgi:hypothetical protein|nr:hypothetical protein [Planctomycetota bacterium]
MNTSPSQSASNKIPLYVDLDGTLIATDSLDESVLRLVAEKPASLAGAGLALLRGRAHFKAWVCDHIAIDPASLP